MEPGKGKVGVTRKDAKGRKRRDADCTDFSQKRTKEEAQPVKTPQAA